MKFGFKIGEKVEINHPNTAFHGRKGKVVSWRNGGYLMVYIYNLHNKRGSSYPFKPCRLRSINNE